MLKNLKLGLKMGLGFGLVIVLVVIVSGIAILNMLTIQQNSKKLDNEYVPEVGIANNVERNSLMTMYNMRGYALSFEDSYWEQGQSYFNALEEYLLEAEKHAEKYSNLTALKEGTKVAQTYATEYDSLAQETRDIIDGIFEHRESLEKNAQIFMDNCYAYLESQNTRFAEEIAGNTSTQALQNRLVKITLINDIIDLGNSLRIANWRGQLENDVQLMQNGLDNFAEGKEIVINIRTITLQAANLQQLDNIIESGDQYVEDMNDIIAAYNTLNEMNVERGLAADKVLEASQQVASKGIETTQEMSSDAVAIVGSAVVIVIIGLAVALVAAVVIALFLTLSITRALKKGVDFAESIARGNLDVTIDIDQRDEIGVLASSLNTMQKELLYKDKMLQEIAQGNLAISIKTASSEDTLGESMVRMTDSLNQLLGQVNMSVDQVNIGSDQVSQASQSLSQGATEQASSLEEISASITQINSQSKQNAENAGEANSIARKAAEDADQGNKQMLSLSEAMGRINTSSDQIKKIVKVIDDIAFQTNLLALNANVEAARAGKYGKGFAVVADEVRNLAVRSAEAVKETTEMVEDSIKNIEEGNHAVELTASQLEAIMTGATKVAEFLDEIASASKEQAEAIDEITQGLEQIDQVTQANTASAEESAAAAEELASQSIQLKNMVAAFKLRNGRKALPSSPVQNREKVRTLTWNHEQEQPQEGPVPSEVIILEDDDFDRF